MLELGGVVLSSGVYRRHVLLPLPNAVMFPNAKRHSKRQLIKTLPRLWLQFICQFCCKPIKQKQYYIFHLRAVHKIGDPVVCPHCGKDDFKAPATYKLHVRNCQKSSNK